MKPTWSKPSAVSALCWPAVAIETDAPTLMFLIERPSGEPQCWTASEVIRLQLDVDCLMSKAAFRDLTTMLHKLVDARLSVDELLPDPSFLDLFAWSRGQGIGTCHMTSVLFDILQRLTDTPIRKIPLKEKNKEFVQQSSPMLDLAFRMFRDADARFALYPSAFVEDMRRFEPDICVLSLNVRMAIEERIFSCLRRALRSMLLFNVGPPLKKDQEGVLNRWVDAVSRVILGLGEDAELRVIRRNRRGEEVRDDAEDEPAPVKDKKTKKKKGGDADAPASAKEKKKTVLAFSSKASTKEGLVDLFENRLARPGSTQLAIKISGLLSNLVGKRDLLVSTTVTGSLLQGPSEGVRSHLYLLFAIHCEGLVRSNNPERNADKPLPLNRNFLPDSDSFATRTGLETLVRQQWKCERVPVLIRWAQHRSARLGLVSAFSDSPLWRKWSRWSVDSFCLCLSGIFLIRCFFLCYRK